jgi:hypothetical protein
MRLKAEKRPKKELIIMETALDAENAEKAPRPQRTAQARRLSPRAMPGCLIRALGVVALSASQAVSLVFKDRSASLGGRRPPDA